MNALSACAVRCSLVRTLMKTFSSSKFIKKKDLQLFLKNQDVKISRDDNLCTLHIDFVNSI